MALVFLGAPGLAQRTAPFVDFARRRIDWLGLHCAASTWQRREKLIVDVAHDLTRGLDASSGGGLSADAVTIADLLIDLDQEDLDLVHAAVDLHLGARTLDAARPSTEAGLSHPCTDPGPRPPRA